MKFLRYFFIGAIAWSAFSCSEDEIGKNTTPEDDDDPIVIGGGGKGRSTTPPDTVTVNP